MKAHFDVPFVWPYEAGSAWIQVLECSVLYVLQGYMVGFPFGYMSNRLWMLQCVPVSHVCPTLRKILEVGCILLSASFGRLGRSPYRWNMDA